MCFFNRTRLFISHVVISRLSYAENIAVKFATKSLQSWTVQNYDRNYYISVKKYYLTFMLFIK